MSSCFQSKTLVCLFFTGICFLAIGRGQETPEAPPSLPLVAQLPDSLSWTMAITIRKDLLVPADPSQPKLLSIYPQEVQITKTGEFQKQVILWTDQSRTTVYFANGLRLYKDPDNGVVIVESGSEDPEAVRGIPRPGYFGIEWLNTKYFQGSVTYKDRVCHHYTERTVEAIATPAEAVAKTSDKIVREAWIDAETRRPLEVVAGFGTVSYKYFETPTSVVTLPDDYQKAWKDYETQIKRLEAMRMR